MSDHHETVRSVLERYGATYAEEARIPLKDKPAPLFQLLVLAMLFAAPIPAATAVAAARELFDAGWRTPQGLLDSTWQQRVDALGRGGYRRYDESTARHLSEMAELLQDRYDGDLRRLRDEAGGDADRIQDLLQEFPRIGATGAAIFCREAQAVWPTLRPFVDDRARAGARAAGLPSARDALARLVPSDDLARLTAALVRLDLDDR
ncbi:endonuclease [Luteipulveratus halotolerans]|uniref:Endonuclease n=1 Tax=Luteipulveratus halotolerans TaxID=1631356 RepID=A0A0L6CLV4_9MICO|nr:endonuclease [Luteipulveratus halotolerans]KNX38714.1 endonuclease [Luteipulveratus halotolerans]